jgi:type IV secretory pathway component VirB8
MNFEKSSIINTITLIHKKINEINGTEYDIERHYKSLITYEYKTLEAFRDGAIERYNSLFK